MTHIEAIAAFHARHAHRDIRKIDIRDLKYALIKGVDDFSAFPTHVIFLGIIYSIIGLILARITTNDDLFPLLYPLAAGFALTGPLAAAALYEVSRRREFGLNIPWRAAFWLSPPLAGIIALSALLTIVFALWITSAYAIYQSVFGSAPPASITDFLHDLFTTPAGWTLIVVGSGVGFLFAAVTLTISIVSFPLQIDRNVGPRIAVQMSIQAVLKNPVPIAVWGLIIIVLLTIGLMTLCVGMAVVMPVLAHSSWHLYRRLVEAGLPS